MQAGGGLGANTQKHRGPETMRALSLVLLLSASGPALAATDAADWPTYGHDKGGQRHSPLTQITTANVARLRPAWVYHMRPADLDAAPANPGEARERADHGVAAAPPRPRFLASQLTPVVAGGRMFITTPYGYAAALDPTTGKELWKRTIAGTGSLSYRGVEYWPGDARTPARILFGTGDGRLIALDAATGQFSAGFGENGVVDLRTEEVMNGLPNAPYHMTSPPLVVGDLVVTGARVQESPAKGASGDVRAWDVRTGKLVWTFHTIPRPGEANHGTWAPGSEAQRSGVNVWGFMTADERRGLLYLPVGGPSPDRYGGDRPGDNLYSSSLVAVDLKTGRYKWHFQIVHHDIWDIDLQAAPLLFEARVRGRTIPAVSLVSKNGMIFMFDRVTGKPLHPIVEKPFPASRTPTEIASPTQPIPATPPLARQGFTFPDDLVDVTPELRAWCADYFVSNKMRSTVQYEPFGTDTPGVHFPGTEGGGNWGGQTFDPKSGLIYVPMNNFGGVSILERQAPPATPLYRNIYRRFQQPETRNQCVKPPWGVLSAVDTATGKIAWQTPLGVSDTLPPGLRNTGRPGNGGAITTASGLLFVGFTDDARFRAFDARTGKELWTYRLEAAAHATPATYRGADGRQYVAVTSTGGSYVESPIQSDALTAFALPD
jgi:quinoprotein glucose dehydrogenase